MMAGVPAHPSQRLEGRLERTGRCHRLPAGLLAVGMVMKQKRGWGLHNLFLPTLKELCGEYGCRSSCGCRIISQKAGVQQGEPQHPGHEEQLSLSPLGPKSQQNCLFPTRMDTSGGHCSHSETQMKGKSKQALISPLSLLLSSPCGPPGKHWQSRSSLQETDQDCQGLTPIIILQIPSFGGFLEVHMALGAAARPKEGCAMWLHHLLGRFHCSLPQETWRGQGSFNTTATELKQAARFLGRQQPKEPQELKPRVTNSSYHLPLGAITAAHFAGKMRAREKPSREGSISPSRNHSWMAFSDLPSPPRDAQVCTHTTHGSATAGVVALLASPGSELVENALDARGEHGGTAAEQELDAAAAAASTEFPFK